MASPNMRVTAYLVLLIVVIAFVFIPIATTGAFSFTNWLSNLFTATSEPPEIVSNSCWDVHFPQCDGGCWEGYTCKPNTETAKCECRPIEDACANTWPGCTGYCSEGKTCINEGYYCRCETGCEQATWPYCGGYCAGSKMCVRDDATKTCACKNYCEFSGPQCNGICPTVKDCVPVFGQQTSCACE